MGEIKVRPWIGENYKTPSIFPYRTLILGESNYTDNPEQFNANIVINCVNDDLTGQDTQGFGKFATKVRNVIFQKRDPVDRETFWKNVAFYNFVQFLVGNKAGVRPTEEMWKDSIPAFKELILELEPERVLVLGAENWENLTTHISPYKTHCKFPNHIAAFMINNHAFIAGYIDHPSSVGFTYSHWTAIINELLFTAQNIETDFQPIVDSKQDDSDKSE